MKNQNFCHKTAIYYIFNNKENLEKKFFENSYIDNLYKNLVKETKKSYKLISLKKDMQEINESLDRKRELSKEFKSLTNITWIL